MRDPIIYNPRGAVQARYNFWGLKIVLMPIHTYQARRQEFPEGGSSTRAKRGALTAGGLGATQGPQKLWGIWSKILKSSNFQALHSNFRKVMFFKTDHMIFTKFYTNLSINLKKTSTLIVLICFQGGVRPNPSNPPPPLATGVHTVCFCCESIE